MTRSIIELKATPDDIAIARLAAAAIALTCLETALPSPLPGVKPGLANIVTLLVLYRFGWRVAAQVSLLRIVAAALLFGAFLTPTFWLALSGGIASLLVLGVVIRLLPPRWFGPVSLSVIAAFAHISAQLLLAYAWLIPHAGVFALAPIFFAAALVTGVVNGVLAAYWLPRFTRATAAMGLVKQTVSPKVAT